MSNMKELVRLYKQRKSLSGIERLKYNRLAGLFISATLTIVFIAAIIVALI